MIGENINNLRIKANLTQDMLAEKLNVTRQALSKWENNKAEPDINMLQNIAIILGVVTDDLISRHHMVQIVLFYVTGGKYAWFETRNGNDVRSLYRMEQ